MGLLREDLFCFDMKTRYLKTSGALRARSIKVAARLIRKGELVAFPTETVYGLGANAYNSVAVKQIFRVKGRPSDNPLIVHLWSIDQIHALAPLVPLLFWRLAQEFMPGPLTLVVKKAAGIPSVVTAGLGTVAVRMPDHPVARSLLKQANVPVVAPSANLSGRPSPTTARHVHEDLDGKISAVLDGGRCKIGLESTVVDISHGAPVILRPGGITKEQIEKALRIKVRVARQTRKRPPSPGMKYRHYAPKAKVIVFEGQPGAILREMKRTARELLARHRIVAVMYDAKGRRLFKGCLFFSLGGGDARSAARHLFSGFRDLDRKGADIILCKGFSEQLMGQALMNRLRKAASRQVRV
jgi:L-threonylcarbamoyladenylate synthase